MGHVVAERLLPWVAATLLITSPLIVVGWFVLFLACA